MWYLQNIIFVDRFFQKFSQTLLRLTFLKNIGLKPWDGGSSRQSVCLVSENNRFITFQSQVTAGSTQNGKENL
jgi:hypothetical protein